MNDPLDVIVTDDNLIQRTYLLRVIEKLGYRTFEAEDGDDALELLAKTGAQILITDYRMPKMDGIELTRRVREMALDHYVHIILVTGSEEDGVRRDALAAGADDFLGKGREIAPLQARLGAASRLIHHAHALAEQHRILKEANARIHADLTAAARAQRQLLPDLHTDVLGMRIASAFVPSAVVSGDMFGCVPLDETRVGFYAVDVSGHGIHASLLSVAIGHLITRDYFANTVLRGDGNPDPAALVFELNQRFSVSDNDDYFTMFCGVLDCASGRLDYCQAAYPSPHRIPADGGEVAPIGDGGFPVGMFPGLSYDNNATQFQPGDRLVICSDAAIEAETPENDAFGTERLRDTIQTARTNGTDALPETIVAALMNWRDGAPLEDDLTVVALERKVMG